MTRREYIRIMKRVDVTETCWLWRGSRSTNRYGVKVYGNVKYRGQTRSPHTVLYEAFYGIVPTGLELDHTCRNTACVNYNHLEPVPHGENVKRGIAGVYHTSKTHCPHGHAYTEDNIYYELHRNGNKHRKCATCVKAKVARYAAKHTAR